MQRRAKGDASVRRLSGGEQALDARFGPATDRIRKRAAPRVAAQSDGLAQPLDHGGARHAVAAMSRDPLTGGGVRLAVEIGGDTGQQRAAIDPRLIGHTASSARRSITRARCSRVFTFASESRAMLAT